VSLAEKFIIVPGPSARWVSCFVHGRMRMWWRAANGGTCLLGL
jgi:hypothetical protein